MSEAELLDDLTGFEFEDLMADVFRKLGYENVRVAEQVADLGRDVIMEEVVDGTRRVVIVECKHTDTVSRPVLQKLHSAVATYKYDGPKRGMIATTGRLTGPAEEYARELRANDDPYPIECLDGHDLREIADDVGLDLYNGRIEIICEETLRPVDPTAGLAAPVEAAFADVENIDREALPDPHSTVEFEPVVVLAAAIDAIFETSVGVIHRIDERTQLLVHARRNRPQVMDPEIGSLVADGRRHTTTLDEETFRETFEDVSVHRFGQTETEYKNWAIDRLQDEYTTTVRYTGDNNVTYTKTCEPNLSDIVVQSIEPVYLPAVKQSVTLQDYTYPLVYYAAGPSRATIRDGIHRCVQCETTDDDTYTYCENCGSINCPSHIKTERLEGEPVCTGCAVTERFFFRTKYFYDRDNLDSFRAEYEAMPFYEKAQENVPLLVGAAVVALLVVLSGLSQAGLF